MLEMDEEQARRILEQGGGEKKKLGRREWYEDEFEWRFRAESQNK